MTISTYQVENVLKAYNKQTRMENQIHRKPEKSNNITDIVTLSLEDNRKETFDRISYNLVDVMLSKGNSVK